MCSRVHINDWWLSTQTRLYNHTVFYISAELLMLTQPVFALGSRGWWASVGGERERRGGGSAPGRWRWRGLGVGAGLILTQLTLTLASIQTLKDFKRHIWVNQPFFFLSVSHCYQNARSQWRDWDVNSLKNDALNVHFCQNLKSPNHSKAKRNMWKLKRHTWMDSLIGRNSNVMENLGY